MRGLLLGVLLLMPAAQACGVTPMLEVDVPQEAPCLRGMSTHDRCDKVPSDPLRLDGVLRWSWDVDECSTEGGVVKGDVRIALSTTTTHPAWLPMTFDPEEVVVPPQEYYDPRHVRYDAASGRLYSEKEQAFGVTLATARAPTAEERERLEVRHGIVVVFVKAHAQGDGGRDSFAVTQLSFDARHLLHAEDSGPAHAAPMPPLAVLLGLVLTRASVGRWRR